ncbi:MAG: enoyl-CoA hydratase-related protein [Pseudomonadota bacterium]|nr:enoyl-CoA hydratase-related protein [Pseudomonadota bacterium]
MAALLLFLAGDGMLNKSLIARNNKAMSRQTIVTETDGRGVATIILNRPEVHNAMNAAMLAEVADAIAGYEADSAVRLMVLRSRRRKLFRQR